MEANPEPDGVDHRPPTVLDPEVYEECILYDHPPFQYAYRIDGPDRVTVVAIEITWLRSKMM